VLGLRAPAELVLDAWKFSACRWWDWMVMSDGISLSCGAAVTNIAVLRTVHRVNARVMRSVMRRRLNVNEEEDEECGRY